MIVFAGPSLPPNKRPHDPAIDWRPPAQGGDLIALLEKKPRTVCLIDGLFETRAAPYHKEALALMAAGTRLLGAASMGALRAAELAQFGMEGVGRIYTAYLRGLLTGDDEVAVVHGPARLDHAPLTVPMVEVRATLLLCVRDHIIPIEVARNLRKLWHDIHYADRDWPLMKRKALAVAAPDMLARIERRHVPLKQQDALACLWVARERANGGRETPAPPRTIFLKKIEEEVTLRR